MLCPLKQDEFPSSTGQEAGRDFIYFDSTIKPCWIALCTANLFCFQSSKPEKAITLIWMTLCQSSTLICLITCIDRKRWDLLLPIYLLHKKHHTACYNCTSFSCLEHTVVSIHFCCLYSCLATVLRVCVYHYPFGLSCVCSMIQILFLRLLFNCLQVQTYQRDISNSVFTLFFYHGLQHRPMPSSVWERQTSLVPKLWIASSVITQTRLPHFSFRLCPYEQD